jgi:hypothetical protein
VLPALATRDHAVGGEHHNQQGEKPGAMPGPLSHSLPGQLAEQKQGLAKVYRMIQAQSAILAFNDIYRVMLCVTVIAIPLLLLLWLWQNAKIVRPQSVAAVALAD